MRIRSMPICSNSLRRKHLFARLIGDEGREIWRHTVCLLIAVWQAGGQNQRITSNPYPFSRPIMTQSELDYYRKKLLDLRRRLLGQFSDVAGEALRPTGGEPSGNRSDVPVHPADLRP